MNDAFFIQWLRTTDQIIQPIIDIWNKRFKNKYKDDDVISVRDAHVQWRIELNNSRFQKRHTKVFMNLNHSWDE